MSLNTRDRGAEKEKNLVKGTQNVSNSANWFISQASATLNHLLRLLASPSILLVTSTLVLSRTAEMSVSTVLGDFPAKRLPKASIFDSKTCPEEPRCVPQVLSNFRYATSVPRPKFPAANLELVQNRGSLLSKSEKSGSFFSFSYNRFNKTECLATPRCSHGHTSVSRSLLQQPTFFGAWGFCFSLRGARCEV